MEPTATKPAAAPPPQPSASDDPFADLAWKFNKLNSATSAFAGDKQDLGKIPAIPVNDLLANKTQRRQPPAPKPSPRPPMTAPRVSVTEAPARPVNPPAAVAPPTGSAAAPLASTAPPAVAPSFAPTIQPTDFKAAEEVDYRQLRVETEAKRNGFFRWVLPLGLLALAGSLGWWTLQQINVLPGQQQNSLDPVDPGNLIYPETGTAGGFADSLADLDQQIADLEAQDDGKDEGFYTPRFPQQATTDTPSAASKSTNTTTNPYRPAANQTPAASPAKTSSAANPYRPAVTAPDAQGRPATFYSPYYLNSQVRVADPSLHYRANARGAVPALVYQSDNFPVEHVHTLPAKAQNVTLPANYRRSNTSNPYRQGLTEAPANQTTTERQSPYASNGVKEFRDQLGYQRRVLVGGVARNQRKTVRYSSYNPLRRSPSSLTQQSLGAGSSSVELTPASPAPSVNISKQPAALTYSPDESPAVNRFRQRRRQTANNRKVIRTATTPFASATQPAEAANDSSRQLN